MYINKTSSSIWTAIQLYQTEEHNEYSYLNATLARPNSTESTILFAVVDFHYILRMKTGRRVEPPKFSVNWKHYWNRIL